MVSMICSWQARSAPVTRSLYALFRSTANPSCRYCSIVAPAVFAAAFATRSSSAYAMPVHGAVRDKKHRGCEAAGSFLRYL